MKRYTAVFLGLLGIVALEVVLTLARPPRALLVAGLLVLAGVQATLAVLYFMHLRYERRTFAWSLILAVVLTAVLMDHFWFDAVRLLHQRLTTP